MRRRGNAIRAAALAAAAAIGCGEPGGQEPNAPAPGGGGAPAVKFKRAGVVDREGIGTEAFSLLVPADWESSAAVRWRLDNPAFPAYGTVRVRNPKGTEEFEVFPNMPFFWTNNQMVLKTNPPGSKHFGNVVRPPAGAEQALREIVLPAFRGAAADLKVVDAKPLPELAKMVADMQARIQPQARITADAARVRVEYETAGRRYGGGDLRRRPGLRLRDRRIGEDRMRQWENTQAVRDRLNATRLPPPAAAPGPPAARARRPTRRPSAARTGAAAPTT